MIAIDRRAGGSAPLLGASSQGVPQRVETGDGEPFRVGSVASGDGGSYGWAVGEKGEIYRLASNTWSATTSPTGNDLWAVAITSPTEAWAVGDNGVILRWVDPNQPGMARRLYLPVLRK